MAAEPEQSGGFSFFGWILGIGALVVGAVLTSRVFWRNVAKETTADNDTPPVITPDLLQPLRSQLPTDPAMETPVQTNMQLNEMAKEFWKTADSDKYNGKEIPRGLLLAAGFPEGITDKQVSSIAAIVLHEYNSGVAATPIIFGSTEHRELLTELQRVTAATTQDPVVTPPQQTPPAPRKAATMTPD